MFEFLAGIEAEIVLSFNHASSFLNRNFWKFITREIYAVPIVLGLVFLALRNKSGREALWIFIKSSLLVSLCSLSTSFAKIGFQRLRPLNDIELKNTLDIVIEASSYSFWSGHAAVSICITFCVWYFTKSSWAIALLVWAVLFSISRLFLAAHYPSDILIGCIVGWTFAFIGVKLLSNKPSAFSAQH
ncbi:MAG: phosphatase PAP2 family protein [Flavobacteriaceae bacterium]|nr:phosphatase PAP2 family protein [Flavobacteriaceae bacterium]